MNTLTTERKKPGPKPKRLSAWRKEANKLKVRVPQHPMHLTDEDKRILTAEDWKHIYFAKLGFMNQVAAIIANARARGTKKGMARECPGEEPVG